jgi:hypothetical protein
MPLLTSRAPRPALSDHPEFAMMLAVTLERLRCTLGEVREDYWLGRVWRALDGDPALKGRMARSGMTTALLTGRDYGLAPVSAKERQRWRLHAKDRVEADTGRLPEALGIAIRWADEPVTVVMAPHLSLLAQTLAGDPRWGDLGPYAEDLAAAVVPVAYTAEGMVAA